MKKIKSIVISITPPFIINILKKLTSKAEYCGDYKDFESARAASTGYDSPQIFSKIKEARQKVASEESSYERDGVVFKENQYFWPVLTSLLYIASKKGDLRVLDYGGSLGTSFFQNLPFLKDLPKLKWMVVEQKHFAEYGRKNLEKNNLKFYADSEVKDLLKNEPADVVFFSSSLQYLPKPYETLDEIMKNPPDYFLFDRTSFAPGSKDRLTIQKVSERVFKNTSLPCWLFGKEKFYAYFSEKFEKISEFPSIGNPISTDTGCGEYIGMLFQRKT